MRMCMCVLHAGHTMCVVPDMCMCIQSVYTLLPEALVMLTSWLGSRWDNFPKVSGTGGPWHSLRGFSPRSPGRGAQGHLSAWVFLQVSVNQRIPSEHRELIYARCVIFPMNQVLLLDAVIQHGISCDAKAGKQCATKSQGELGVL